MDFPREGQSADTTMRKSAKNESTKHNSAKHNPAISFQPHLIVFYDALCPACVKDRDNYLRWAGQHANHIHWQDATAHQTLLAEYGVTLEQALLELYVYEIKSQHMLKEIPAYARLFQAIPKLRWLGWLISTPIIKPLLTKLYRYSVRRRLNKQGRLCKLPR